MLSGEVLKAFKLTCKIAQLVASFPIAWDPVQSRASLTTSRKFYIRWYAGIIYLQFNMVFMAIRLVQAARFMDVGYGMLFLNLMNVVTWACAAAMQFNTLNQKEEIIAFINQFLSSNENFDRMPTYELPSGESSKRDGSTARKITYSVYAYSLAQFFIALRSFDLNPKYVFTLTGIRGVARWKGIPIALFECYMSFYVSTTLAMNINIFYAYVKGTVFSIQGITYGKVEEVPVQLRRLQLLNREFNLCYGKWVMPSIFFVLAGVNMVCNYATIRLFHHITLPGFLGFPMLTLATTLVILETYPASYQMYEGSERLIRRTLEQNRKNRWMHKFFNSCFPLSIRVGNYFFVKRFTTITYFRILVDYAIILLLTF